MITTKDVALALHHLKSARDRFPSGTYEDSPRFSNVFLAELDLAIKLLSPNEIVPELPPEGTLMEAGR